MKRQMKEFRDFTAFYRSFAKEEDGMVTIFACFMIFCMIMIGGIGVDMMRHEMERTRIQAVADRAVLAAADLDQLLDPTAVVHDYFAKSGMADFVSNVEVNQGLNFRNVKVDASTTVKTQFMDYLGVDNLIVPGVSRAEEKVNKVEISLVVDISGSMKNNGKMDNLKNAAATFIDTVLDDTDEDLISVSLVPYSEHVNAGPMIYDQLNVNTLHNYSHCIEFPDSEFSSVALNKTMTYEQMQHYQWNSYSNESGNTQNTRYDTVCPRYSYERIIPTSQNASYLKGQISQLKPRAGTSIFLGMKWGSAMLDPSFRSINYQLANQGNVDAVFANRPTGYNDDETLKTIILMTDGQNDKSMRIPDYYYDSSSEIVHWANYNLNYYLSRYVNSYYHRNFYTQKYDASQGDGLLSSVCEAAKEKKIVIWTIGFEVQDHGANVMRDCASSPSHFFRVEGVEITEAFSSIARQINQLRLTQ
ncbi:hypothetical protein Z946_2858 [Sulfitobacter noctilucicola]|uniref:VWFA domain-containing protein n=1 Tax=Sulfitobacter noctilucicola TaxID=1342301 RepID=A0A7W6MA80_9RHOB|nr:Tad domain-containing protein [Sulfitobacter noctilucicola]KIN63975.1 hypothetical protein Z946_2858 [Sulfitobacter noctilucicola]MBB4175331.1 hypothetical protein [Sulfitobacter noctilucicola]